MRAIPLLSGGLGLGGRQEVFPIDFIILPHTAIPWPTIPKYLLAPASFLIHKNSLNTFWNLCNLPLRVCWIDLSQELVINSSWSGTWGVGGTTLLGGLRGKAGGGVWRGDKEHWRGAGTPPLAQWGSGSSPTPGLQCYAAQGAQGSLEDSAQKI